MGKHIKIVVGGRFDYIRTVWSHLAEKGEIMFFDENPRTDWNSIENRVRRRIENLISPNNDWYKIRQNYREFFPIDCLSKNDEIIFIIYEMNLMSTDFETIKAIKKHFPKSKFVLFFSNKIGSVRQELTQSILANRQLFNLIYTFDAADAINYKLLHWNGNFPYNPISEQQYIKYKTDVYFNGKDKGRLKYLLKIFNHLTSIGLNCKFIVFNDNPDLNNDLNKIPNGFEITDKYIPYSEITKFISGTKCLLDISTTTYSTIRYSEAIAYRKKLITNASGVNKDELFNPNQIKIFTKLDDLNIDFIRNPISEKDFIDPSLISVEAFLNDVKKRLYS